MVCLTGCYDVIYAICNHFAFRSTNVEIKDEYQIVSAEKFTFVTEFGIWNKGTKEQKEQKNNLEQKDKKTFYA